MRSFPVFLLMLSLPFAVIAEDSSVHYGYLGSAQWVSISDPEGQTKGQGMLVPLGGFVSFDAARDLRYRVDVSYLSGSLNPGVGQVGQDFTSWIMAASVNWRWRFSRTVKPWIGAGVTVSQSEFSTRYTVDSGGYLADEYPDRTQTGYAATIMAANYWELNRSIQLGVEVLVDIPVSTDLRRIGIGASLLF